MGRVEIRGQIRLGAKASELPFSFLFIDVWIVLCFNGGRFRIERTTIETTAPAHMGLGV